MPPDAPAVSRGPHGVKSRALNSPEQAIGSHLISGIFLTPENRDLEHREERVGGLVEEGLDDWANHRVFR